MAALAHVYMTAHGEWTAANWLGEKAQIGVRCPIVEQGAEPALGAIYTPVANGDVDLDSGTTAGTHGTLQRTFTARMGPIGSLDNMDAGQQIDMAEDFWTFLNAIKTNQYNGFKWTHVKIAPILADGTYGAPSATYTFTSPLVGASAAGTLPPEVALAVSFRAPIIGRRGRGRFYIPALAPSLTLAADGTASTGAITPLLAAAKTLSDNLKNVPGADNYTPMLSVLSAGSVTAVRPAEIRVGNHWDAQRRRQHQVPETYTSQAL